jgi:hypothetical protein
MQIVSIPVWRKRSLMFQEKSSPFDAQLAVQRPRETLPQHDAGILYQVALIRLKIA